MRARSRTRFDEAGPHALAGHFQKSERTDTPNLYARAVGLKGILQTPLYPPDIAVFIHVDEVDHDQSGEIAQPELAGDFLGRLQIGLVGSFLDVAFAGGSAGIHVYCHQGFSRVDDNITAGFELHGWTVHRRELFFDPVALEEWDTVLIRLNPLCMTRHQHFHEGFGGFVAFFAVDKDLRRVLRVEVTDRALDDISVFVNQAGRSAVQCRFANAVPKPKQVLEISSDFCLIPALSCRAHDEPHAVGNFESFDYASQFLAVRRIRDLAADATAAGRIGHQHAISAGERKVRRECRALVAALFLDDLD